MKAHILEKVTGTLMTLLLLAGGGLLTGCASNTDPPAQVNLAAGTRWRDVAKVAGTSNATFSYRMNGRKYDKVTFEKTPFPVVFEDGRLYAVISDEGGKEWDRRLEGCMKMEELPLENGLGPLHSFVIEQRRLNQRQGPPKEEQEDQSFGPGDVALAGVVAGLAYVTLPIWGSMLMVSGADYAMTGKSRREAQVVNDTLLDSGVSYAPFLGPLGKPYFQTCKGSYCVRRYQAASGLFTELRYPYDVGVKDGRVLWVARDCFAVTKKVGECREAHGMGYVTDEQIGEKRKAIDHQ